MRKHLLVFISLALALAGFIATVNAEEGYGTAGCGLGSLVFGSKPGIIQIFAATTNAIFGTQTFGITTGTSNCVDTKTSAQSTKAFIEANRETVHKEVARGSGETISSISSLAGCQNPAAVGSTLQKEFTAIFPNEQVSDTQVSEALVNTLAAHPELACHALI
jgi:hypothetical protein